MFRIVLPIILTSAAGAACAAPEADSEARSQAQRIAGEPEKTVSEKMLPLNRRFPSLDAYLLHLKTVSGPSDGPWYREIRPGVYQLETPLRRHIVAEGEKVVETKPIFTREELMKKFGFSK